MKKVYGYIRVSTAKQGEGVSMVVQKEAIIKYAAQFNLKIIQWFEEKETAAKLGRPLFLKMMQLLRLKRASGVIIHKIDRSARNLKDWADLGNLIDKGVEIHFAHESLDLRARGGRLSADIQAVIAADYIRNLRQEAIKGLYGRLEQGIFPFHAPAGYINHGGGKVKTICPQQGPLVRLAFQLYSTKRYTLESLTGHMRDMGLYSRRNRLVSKNGLWKILGNPYYMGVMKVNKQHYNGIHEPLITPTLFKTVQDVLKGKTNQSVIKHDYKFRKAITCSLCGYSLIAEKQKSHIYYRCHTKGCITATVRESYVEMQLLAVFKKVQLAEGEVAELTNELDAMHKKWKEKQAEILKAVKIQKAQIADKVDRLTDCYVDGGLDKETYQTKKLQLLTELKAKEGVILDGDQNFQLIKDKVIKFLELLKNLAGAYESGVIETQRELVKLVTSNLSAKGKQLIISMRSPFQEVAEMYPIYNGALTPDTPRQKDGCSGRSAKRALTSAELKDMLGRIVEMFGKELESGPETLDSSLSQQ